MSITHANLIAKRKRYFGDTVDLTVLTAALAPQADPLALDVARSAYSTQLALATAPASSPAPDPSVAHATVGDVTAAVAAEAAIRKAPALTTKTADYTLALADAGTVLEMNSASAHVITVPTNAAVAFPIGSLITLSRLGAGSVTITPAGGVTVRSAAGALAISAQYAGAVLRKRAADEWVLTGSLS